MGFAYARVSHLEMNSVQGDNKQDDQAWGSVCEINKEPYEKLQFKFAYELGRY